MKKAIFILICLLQLTNIFCQSSSNAQLRFQLGMRYLMGVSKPYNPEKARQLFFESAAEGNTQAMNGLGNIHAKGLGVPVNLDSAMTWYKTAAAKGYAKGYLNLGQIYKAGAGVKQNFATAFDYFSKGVLLSDVECKSALAYMYYKGFGTTQNYNLAFQLNKEAAESGNSSAMYFLGLCYKNGYGTTPDNDAAKLWLAKAGQKNEAEALRELNSEAVPENVSVISSALQDQLTALKSFKEKFQAASGNNYEGNYTGFAVYYDWSGQYVSEIQPLQLSLEKNGAGYKGQWLEGNSEKTPVDIMVSGNQLAFAANNQYSRTNHYSGRVPEVWQFNAAKLELGFSNDSVQLSGYVHFYSPTRNEPGKPLQIILKKGNVIQQAKQSDVINLDLYPNPAQTQTTTEFTLLKTARVGIRVTSQLGVVVYSESEKLLPAGKYSYSIPLSNLPASVYNVHVLLNGAITATKPLVKQ